MANTVLKYALAVAVLLAAALCTAGIFSAIEVNAQPSVSLKLHKDFGYSDFGNGAQGKWTAQAAASQDTTRVEFYLDSQLQANDTQSPFEWSYNTDNYILGLHTIKAVAFDSNGNQVIAEKQQNFVEPSNALMGIVYAAIIVVVVIIVIIVVLMKRNKRETRH